MSHPDLDPAAQARLVTTFGAANPASATGEPTAAAAEAPAPSPRARLRSRVRNAARPVADPALDRLADLVARRLRHTMRSELNVLAANVELLRAEHVALQQALDGADGFTAGTTLPRLNVVEVNAELMKGDLAAFRATLDDLGQAIAPAAGLAGVPARFAELREQVNALDRRARVAEQAIGTPAGATSDVSSPTATGATAEFDYVGFERRFRGDSDAILATLAERYSADLVEHQPVLDFGCGRGELVEVLGKLGISASGVDTDTGMVEEAIGHGRAVRLGNGIDYLRSLTPGSLGAMISVHVVEHLPLPALVELFELAATRLQPGGVFIAETPNPMSLIVLGNSYILDPTHVWPLHPSLLTFLAERAGFRDVALRFYSPADDYRLAPIGSDSDAPPWVSEINVAIEQLNHVLFGPQEYALVARMPPE